MVRALNEKARVYYGQCSNHHYVLLDPEAPAFQKNPPKASHNTVCRGCGPNYQVALETIKVGGSDGMI